ncbi:DUF1152 domain-containing protein [Streptomyces luomodiensis]|uniref:DUF1152 domain-containing protein n=1 Tax=Streptomyces luomodiensis TaxID=3026192 RepID=A0ABY9V000_9ACTN|nr:DUF1152 domain-containing protein [Streptomyces sp. SCA4-21]WNE97886.1 DUF1152 domain-containing protein [Streptomyces sp. SCA4-21]
MTRLIVAGGGGGDAVAAAVIDRALYRDGTADDRAVVLTYAWDRLLVDPVPGPRGAVGFTGLRALTPSVYAVPEDAKPVAPAGSTLPRLAAELPHTFALLDPHHGVTGMVRQLEEVIEHLAPASVDLLDVGGDILARGDEPTLRSPLGDALSLAACAQVDAEIRLLVAGPGLDGEIPVAVLRERLGAVVHTLTAEDVAPIGPVMEWHPSEATGMLTAAARGVRGLCEVRDAGLTIPLTDDGPVVHEADLDAAFRRNLLAGAIADTTGLAEAEGHCRDVCGYSEIDYEREKAARFRATPEGPFRPRAVLDQVARYAEEAHARGVSHTTFRRLTEVLGLSGAQRADLRALLIGTQPERYDAPLWRL